MDNLILPLPGFVLFPLTKGLFTKIDSEDFKKVNQWKWHTNTGGHKYYAARGVRYGKRSENKSTNIMMHRFLLGGNDSLVEVDHINGDSLDNRKSNLRICTHAQNSKNLKVRKDNTSGFKGVCFTKERWRGKRWCAYINSNNKRIGLGRFLTKEEAALKYNEAVEKYHGEFGRMNTL